MDNWFNVGDMKSVTHIELIDEIILRMIGVINERVSKFTKEGSGWIISELREFQNKVTEYTPLKGSSYVELPEKFQNSKFKLINMKNSDQECFKWCVARSGCLERSNNDRVSSKVKDEVKNYNWVGIKFPMTIKQIEKFENQNDVSIGVYGLDDKLELYTLYGTEVVKTKHVMLLLIEEDGNNHCVDARFKPICSKAS
jgi:hypothetical protein